MLTLPSRVYNLDTVYYYHFKFQQMQGGDVHDYDTRARNIYWTATPRTTPYDYEIVPSHAG